MAKRRPVMATPRRGETRGPALQRLEAALAGEPEALTASGRAVATYLRENLALVPFETGASIAAKTGVSEMSVIRVIRGLGYASLKQLKDDLRNAGADEDRSIDDMLDRFRVRRDDMGDLRTSLELELRAVVKAYELTAGERWKTVVDLLAARPQVYVVGFQASKGVALDFANRLKYARPDVRFSEGAAGVYSEVLESNADESCLVLIDTLAYARKATLLARRAREMGLPLVIVTDQFSNWGYEFTDHVLQGYTHVRCFWDSPASLSIILNLLINAVAIKLGKSAEDRFERMKELGRYFREFEPLPRQPRR